MMILADLSRDRPFLMAPVHSKCVVHVFVAYCLTVLQLIVGLRQCISKHSLPTPAEHNCPLEVQACGLASSAITIPI